MHKYWMSLAGVLLLGSVLHAQQPAAPTAPVIDPRNPLDAHLIRWEQEMKKVETLAAQCTRTRIDKTFGSTDIYEGTARFYKPNMAMLEMQKKGKPDVFEKYICTGTFLYEYVPGQKIIRVHELPPPKQGQVSDESFLSFLFGMKAEECKRRYDLKLAKEDQWYVYLEINPRFAADKVDFQRARLVLNKSTYLPRELWFEEKNGNEITWDIPKSLNGAQINRTEFTAPNVPQGWSMVRVPRPNEPAPNNPPPNNPNVPPRVIRQNQ